MSFREGAAGSRALVACSPQPYMDNIDLLPDVQHMVRHARLLQPGTTLIVAVSGGPDSLTLLHLLLRMAPEWRWRLHVAHLDHGLRGKESLGEASFVAGVAASWGLSATVEWRDVQAHAEATRQGLQAAARELRYNFLAQTAFEQEAAAVVVAHQANDQAETLLHHLVRGAGPEGMAGMRPRLEWRAWRRLAGFEQREGGPALVRPLINILRRRVEDYCRAHRLQPTADPSNRSLHYTRIRIREQLLPLVCEMNPRAIEALGRMARLAAQQADDLQYLLDQHWPNLACEQPDRITFDPLAWKALLPTLRRMALRQAAVRLNPWRSLEAAQIDRALEAIQSGSAGLDLGGGLRLTASPSGIVLARQRQDGEAPTG